MENLSAAEETMGGTGPIESTDRVPMHPDDFAAQLSWITAKRFHETGLGKVQLENLVWFRIIGGLV